jgi:hypothetical protein
MHPNIAPPPYSSSADASSTTDSSIFMQLHKVELEDMQGTLSSIVFGSSTMMTTPEAVGMGPKNPIAIPPPNFSGKPFNLVDYTVPGPPPLDDPTISPSPRITNPDNYLLDALPNAVDHTYRARSDNVCQYSCDDPSVITSSHLRQHIANNSIITPICHSRYRDPWLAWIGHGTSDVFVADPSAAFTYAPYSLHPYDDDMKDRI